MFLILLFWVLHVQIAWTWSLSSAVFLFVIFTTLDSENCVLFIHCILHQKLSFIGKIFVPHFHEHSKNLWILDEKKDLCLRGDHVVITLFIPSVLTGFLLQPVTTYGVSITTSQTSRTFSVGVSCWIKMTRSHTLGSDPATEWYVTYSETSLFSSYTGTLRSWKEISLCLRFSVRILIDRPSENLCV